ncbi:MAG: response regulator, partial [Myxococcales bacterium]|nr:response regulator [Myxococcales bacterium]
MPETLLCVDADRNYCEILARAFRAEGYAVHTTHDGEAALELAARIEPDLVTMDVLLPKRDGFSVLEELRTRGTNGSRTPVLLLSGCTATPAYRSRASRLEAAALLTKPVPLDRLLALVAKQLGNPRSAKKRASARPVRRSRGTAQIQGSLGEVPFPALLHHLHGLRASGVLHLQSGKKKKRLQLVEGRPVAVKSNLVEETLGRLLVASGRITPDVLHASVLRVKQGQGLQGQILVAMHMLDEDDLGSALRQQAEEKFFEVFGWEEGQFRFQRGVRVKGASTLSLKGSPANLISRGVQMRVPQAHIDKFFRERGDCRISPSESPFYRFQDIALDETDQALLGSIDGKSTLGDLLPLDQRARRLVYAWHAIELVDLERSSRTQRPGVRRERVSTSGSDALPRAVARSVRQRNAQSAPRVVAPPGSQPTSPEEVSHADLRALSEKLRGRDHFEVLGVVRTAGEEEVRTAYFELAKTTHPDRFTGASEAIRRVAEEVFGTISQAYETLGNRDRRVAYLRAERDRERDEAAVEEAERAVMAEVEYQKGLTRMKSKNYSDALACFDRAVAHYPEEAEYLAWRGWAFYLDAPNAVGRIGEARHCLLQARKLAPDNEKVYLFLGRLFRAEGRNANAEKMFQR